MEIHGFFVCGNHSLKIQKKCNLNTTVCLIEAIVTDRTMTMSCSLMASLYEYLQIYNFKLAHEQCVKELSENFLTVTRIPNKSTQITAGCE